MKRSVFTVLLFFACTSFVFSADFVASVTGPYNVAATWGGGGVPVAADNIEINAGVTVTMVANVTGINLVRVNGTLDLAGNDLTSNDFAGTGVVDNSSAGTTSTFTFGDGSTRTFSGRIRDTGVGSFLNIVKEGAGIQILSGTASNDFSGTTVVNGGDLTLNKTDGVQAIGGDILIGDGTGIDNLELRSYNQINDNSIITVNSASAVADRGRFSLNGYHETIGGLSGAGGDGQIVANISGAAEGPEDPCVLTIEVDGVVTHEFDGNIRDNNVGVGTPSLSIVKTGGGTQILKRVGGADTDLNLSGEFTISAGHVILDDLDGLSVASFNINTGAAGGLTFKQTTLDFDADFPITGTGKILKQGATNLILSGNNTFTGEVRFQEGATDAGAIRVASNTALGVGPKEVLSRATNTSKGTFELIGGVTLASDITLRAGGKNDGGIFLRNISGNNTWAGEIQISNTGGLYRMSSDAGTLNISGDVSSTIANPRTYTFQGDGDINVSGVIKNGSSSTMSIERDGGTGTLILSGANTYNGSTEVVTGKIELGASGVVPDGSAVTVGASGIFDLKGFNETVGSIAGSGVIDNTSGAGTYTLTSGSNDTDTEFSGVIQNTSGTLALLKEGEGTLTLSGNSTFTGDVDFKNGNILDGGIIALTNSGALGIGPKDINMPGGNANQNQIRLSNNITISNMNIFTRGRNGTNREILINTSGDNTWDGDITINGTGGSYEIQSDAGSLTIVGDLGKTIANNRTFSFRGNGDIEIQGVISDGSAGGETKINKGNSGVLTLSGTNTYSGNTELTGGTIKLGSSNSIPNTSAVTVGGGATFDMNGFNDDIGSLSGSGQVDNTSGAGTYTLGTGLDNTDTEFTGNIVNTTGEIKLEKQGTGTFKVSGVNTYSGRTSIIAGILQLGSATALPVTTDLEMLGTGVLDLNTFDVTVFDINNSVNTASITDNAAGAGTSTFTMIEQESTVECLLLDGATRSLAVKYSNAHSPNEIFLNTNPNTFSGGLTLLDGSTRGIGKGTRLRLNSALSNVGSPGAITSSPLGTGTIFLGEAVTDKSHIMFASSASITIMNDIVFNTALGGDAAGIRIDGTGHVISGDITANLSEIRFSARNGVDGEVTLSGQLTGAGGGLIVQSDFTGKVTTVLTNTGALSNYSGITVAGILGTIKLGAADQIPDGSAVTVTGTLDLGGFSETVASIAGSGVIDNTAGAGTYTLTTGGDDTDTEFSGVIQNTSGTLALFKEGNGTFTLSGNSTFTGDISFPGGSDVEGGIISVTNSGGLGIGPKDVNMLGNNNTVQRILLSGGITINDVNIRTEGRNNGKSILLESVSGDNTWGGDITIIGLGGAYYVSSLADELTILGDMLNNVVNAREFRFNCVGDITISGVISDGTGGDVSLEKRDNGTLLLSGLNTYSGLTDIRNGVVMLGSISALGDMAGASTVTNGASIDLNGNNHSSAEPLTVQGTGDGGNGAIYNSNASAGTFAGPITLAANATFTAGNNMTLSGDISGSGFDLTKNGANTLTFVSNTVTVEDLALSAGTIDAGTSTINIEEAFSNSGTFTPNNGEVRFIGTALQTIPDVDFHDLEIVNASGVNLSADIAVDGLVDMTTGILNTGAFEIDLGSAGSLDESNPNTLAPTSYITGDVKATRNLIQSVANTFGNLGLTITEANIASNSTVVIRTTGTAYTAIGNSSILRGFDISPTTNTGLDATLVSDYFNHEIGGHTESNLVHYRSTNGGTSWTERSTSVNIGTNKATTSGISAFSIWTLSDVTNEPLPINLTNFYADVVRGAVELTWVTASEINNDFFTIEKSTDGINWVVVGKVSGSGSTREETTYHFTDNDPFNGQSYYKLTQTDFNGDKESFDQVSVNLEGSLSTTCSLYPLPASGDELNLLINGTEYGEYDLELVNSLGITLESFSVMHNSESNIVDIKRFTPSHILEHNYLVLKLDGVSKCVQRVVFN